MDPRRNPFSGLASSLDDAQFALLQSAVAERRCRDRIGVGTFEEALAAFRPNPECPECGREPSKDGRTPAGRQRYACPACGRRFSAFSGIVFEYGKKELSTWADFITLMCYNAPLDLAAEMCGIAHTTAFEWRHRVFATVDGYQDGLVLRDRVWIDETYVPDSSLIRGPDWKPKRGPWSDHICISVAIDVHKNAVAVVCGSGKPTSRRIKGALLGRIEEGSVIVHDRERSHLSLVREARCTDESYRADVTDPAYLEGMEMVNSLCSWIKRFLWRFPGMKPGNLQSYLNWFAYLFRVKRDDEKWPKTERVIRHLLMSEAYFRS